MLKSVFIVLYLGAAMGVLTFGVSGIVSGANMEAAIGLVLTSAPILLFVSYWMVFQRTARTSGILVPVMAMTLVGAGLVVHHYVGTGMSEREALLAIVMLFGYLAYDFWYARLGRGKSRLSVGSRLPEFNLISAQGDVVASNSLTGQSTILVFFRGNWCPLCMAQIKEIAGQYSALAKAGVRTVFISPQPQGHSRSLASKFDVAMEFMRDEGNNAAKVLGIEQRFGTPMGMQVLGYESETVLPTVIITNPKGHIVWLHETDNYRVRPEPETYFQVLRANDLI